MAKRDDVGNDKVDRLSSTDDGLMLGALLGYDFKLSGDRVFGFEFDPRWDVSDEIGGLFTLRSHHIAPFGGAWQFRGGIETIYASEDYMDEFFSINAADSAASGLSTFNADAGFKDVGANASPTYRFAGNWSATGILRYTRLVGDAEDSPVTDDVGDENQVFGGPWSRAEGGQDPDVPQRLPPAESMPRQDVLRGRLRGRMTLVRRDRSSDQRVAAA